MDTSPLLLSAAHLAALVLAVCRLTDMLLVDRIFARLRPRLTWYVFSCPRCLSVWVGALLTGVYLVLPWLNWPLALGWAYLFLHRRFRLYEEAPAVRKVA